jgi:hypothetical protein
VLRRIHLQHEHIENWSATVKTIQNIHAAWLAAAASAIVIAGTAGIASADTTTTAPATGQAVQQEAGATAAPSTPAAAPSTQPAKKKRAPGQKADKGTKRK